MTVQDKLSEERVENACRNLVLRAAALADGGYACELAALFTPDAVLARPSGEVLEGRKAIEASYAQRPADRITRHLVTNILVDVESEMQARALSYVLLWTGSAQTEAGRWGRAAQSPLVVGEFEDRFTRTQEGWRIVQREARFVLHAVSTNARKKNMG